MFLLRMNRGLLRPLHVKQYWYYGGIRFTMHRALSWYMPGACQRQTLSQLSHPTRAPFAAEAAHAAAAATPELHCPVAAAAALALSSNTGRCCSSHSESGACGQSC